MSEQKTAHVSAGTQVVVTTEARGTNAMPVHPRGAVGIIARTPAGTEEHYRIRFPDGLLAADFLRLLELITFSMTRYLRILVAVAALLTCRALAADPLDKQLERIFGAKKEFEVKSFGPAKWQDDGASYTTLEHSPETKSAKEIVRYDTESGRRTVLFTAAQLTPPGPNNKPLAIDDYAWSKDGKWLLIFTNAQKVWRQKTRGDYWVLERANGKLRQLGGTVSAATLLFAKFSPDSSRVAYVRANNLYVEDVSSGRIKQLTADGSTTIINGTGDWVNEEEFNIRDGFRWSNDSRNIAYWQFDTTGVREFTMLKTTVGVDQELTRIPYPTVGTQNSAVRIGVVAASGGKTRWMKLPGDPREHYVCGMSWVKGSSELLLHQLNRLQNKLELYLGDSRNGEVALLFQDADKAWVSVSEQPQWTHDGRTLLIMSERDGWQHAYAVSRADRTTRLLTPQPGDVISLLGSDAMDEWLYYIASPTSATQRFLHRARLDGTGKTERLTPADGPGTHTYTISPDGRFSFHTYSTFEKAPVTSLIRLPTHQIVRVVEDNQALQGKIADLVRPTEFFTVEAGAGVNLDGWMIRPKDFTPEKRYPVIVFIYGEPWSVTVTDAWSAVRTPFHWALADAGYIVLSMDNRGTPAPKGRDWRKVVYGDFNSIAVQDQTAALKNLLRQRSYLDASRVGVWGHSGGGANTVNLLFRSPETYHVGVASAPVTDQALYCTTYQERYMGLPTENGAGYRNGSPITYAEGLRGKLLLIHGGADDNVHYQHSERLINRLVELEKPFDLMVYPDGSHSLNEGKGYALHRYRLMARHFQTHLPAGGRTPTEVQLPVPAP